MIDFSPPPTLADRRACVRRSAVEQVIPLGVDPQQPAHGPDMALNAEFVERAPS